MRGFPTAASPYDHGARRHRIPGGAIQWHPAIMGSTPWDQGKNGTTSTLTLGRLYGFPMLFPATDTIRQLGFHLQAPQAGKKARLGLYAANVIATNDLRPGALLIDGGELDLSASGFLPTADLNYVVTGPTLVFVAILTNVAAVTMTFNTYDVWAAMGIANADIGSSSTQQYGWYAAQAYGALPATFPAATALTYSTPGNFVLWVGL